ncbi:MAG: UbiA family prenyltransferase [Planctomycetota bacterium]
MMRLRSNVMAVLALCRLSNLPTVVSNVLVGVAIGAGIDNELATNTIVVLAVAMCLLYAGGMALNDVLDAAYDAIHANHRPIPSGRISRRSALVVTIVCLAGGVGLTSLASPRAAAGAAVLVACIIVYNRWHKVTAIAAIAMGLCRGLIYVTAAVAVAWPPGPIEVAVPAVGLALYIILLTVIARSEHDDTPSPARWLVIWMIVAGVLTLVVPWRGMGAETAVFMCMFIGWVIWASVAAYATPPRIGASVLGWLAGISLLDAMLLSSWGQTEMASLAGLCFLCTLVLHRFILGT